jgi:hypothetical protein
MEDKMYTKFLPENVQEGKHLVDISIALVERVILKSISKECVVNLCINLNSLRTEFISWLQC